MLNRCGFWGKKGHFCGEIITSENHKSKFKIMEEKFAAGGGSVRRKVRTPEEAEGWRREEVLYRELFIRCKVGYVA